jgi:hypothetical protein
LIGFGRRLRSGFAGFCRYKNKQIENQPNNKHQQITATKTLTITTTKNKKNQQNTTTKNQQIHQYWTESVKLKVVTQQNRRDLAKIRLDLGKISLDLARSLDLAEISPDLVRSHLI